MSIAKDADGQVYLLKGGVPGDVVTATIRRKKKGMPFGDVAEITTPSPDRVQAVCQHFEDCGGCKWQDLSYTRQTELKERQVHDAIQRIAKITEYDARPVMACEQAYGYRNKLEFTFSPKRWLTEHEVQSGAEFPDRRALGFHMAGAFDKILPITECHHMPSVHNDIRNRCLYLAKELNISFYDVKSHIGILRNLMIRYTTLEEIMVVLIISADIPEVLDRLLKPLIQEFPQVTSWQYIVNDKLNDSLHGLQAKEYFGESHIREKLGNKEYLISARSFFQTNSRQAEKLYTQVRDYAELTGSEVVYDLYCGTGSIGIFLADACAKMVGIEEIPEAILDARQNAKLNQLVHCHFEVGDVQQVVNEAFVRKHGTPDVLITDPPRAGMHADVVDFIKHIGAKRIVYVSCNPATMARDLALMSDRYRLISCTPVDMFPQTSHVEAVCQLEHIQ